MSVRTLSRPGRRMAAATSVAIAVATHPAAGVPSESVQLRALLVRAALAVGSAKVCS